MLPSSDSSQQRAEIIAIGSELTSGARLDTNSRWLSTELQKLGWPVGRHTTIADAVGETAALIREAASRSRIVVITGGLGPTRDDVTREAIAAAFNQRLICDRNELQYIRGLFAARGREMPERNECQALHPEGGSLLHNANGTAPGIILKFGRPAGVIAALPGVPAEMKAMFHDQLTRQLPRSPVRISRSVIRTFGLGESDVERRLGDLTARDRNPEVGITASNAVISLSVTATGRNAGERRTLTETARRRILRVLGDFVFTETEEDLPEVVARSLAGNPLRLGILEGASTAGLLGRWLAEHPAARECVTLHHFHDEFSADTELLRASARRILSANDVDYVISSSGASEINDGPVRRRDGLVTLTGSRIHRSQDVSMTGNLAVFPERAFRWALNLVRLELLRLKRRSGSERR